MPRKVNFLPQCAVCEFFVTGIKKIPKFSIIWIFLDWSMWRPGKFLCLFSSPSRVKRDHKRDSHWVRKRAWSECQNNVALDLLFTVVLSLVARRQAWRVCQSWKYQRFRLSSAGPSCSNDGPSYSAYKYCQNVLCYPLFDEQGPDQLPMKS